MNLTDIIKAAGKSGLHVKEKPGEPGHFTLTKRGMVRLEVFEISGRAAMIIDAGGPYPAQVSCETWTDIIFPASN